MARLTLSRHPTESDDLTAPLLAGHQSLDISGPRGQGGADLRPGKTEVRIFDYVDREVPMLLRMYERRLRGYRAIGYTRGEAPPGFAEPADEVVVEYDAEAIDAPEAIDFC